MSAARTRAALVVTLLTALVALWLRYETAYHRATGADSTCHFSETLDCDAVQASEYADVLGVSLSTWGAVASLVLFTWVWLARRRGGTLLAAAGALAALGFLAVLVTAALSWFVLGKVCLYCTLMQVGFLAAAVLVVPPAVAAFRAGVEPRLLARGGVLAAGILVLALAGEAYAKERTHLQRLFTQPGGAALRLDVSGDLTLGDPGTPVSVVVFFDFGCPYCLRCYEKATWLVEKHPDCVHVRFKNFPLDREWNPELDRTVHVNSRLAAAAGAAAASLGQDAKALAYLFEHRDNYTQDVLDDLGRVIGVPTEQWRALRQSKEAEQIVRRDIAEGNDLGLTGVPVAYINGRFTDAQRLTETVERLCGQ